MILIDTSAWVEFFRRRGDVAVKSRVARLVETGEAAYCGPVLYELIVGARPGETDFICQTFQFCELLEYPLAAWEIGASLEKRMRANGATVPRDDILVAAAAIHHGHPLYASDKHFVSHRRAREAPTAFDLKTWKREDGGRRGKRGQVVSALADRLPLCHALGHGKG